jgi:protein-disulfide isomerase
MKKRTIETAFWLTFLLTLAPIAVQSQTNETPKASRETSQELFFRNLPDDAVKGAKTVPVLILEFSDYQCPFCARYSRETFPLIQRDYIKTGKVKYVFRDFPIETIHPQAPKAHEAAHCAGEQGKYWEMHDRLFANQKALGRSDLSRHAEGIKLDLARFDPCLDSGRHRPKVMKDIADGLKAGVKGTPTFLLGLRGPDGEVVNAATGIRGAAPYDKFKAAIDSLLSSPK